MLRIIAVLLLLLLCTVCWKLPFTLRVHTARPVRSRTSTRSHQGTESSNGRNIGGLRHAGNALGRFGPGFYRGCVRRGAQGVNPTVSRYAGPSSARNEGKRLSESVLFLRDNRKCQKSVRTVFTLKKHTIWYYTFGLSGSEQIEVARRRPGAAECRNERHMARLASRRGGDGAHMDIERGKLGSDRIGDKMVPSAASKGSMHRGRRMHES